MDSPSSSSVPESVPESSVPDSAAPSHPPVETFSAPRPKPTPRSVKPQPIQQAKRRDGLQGLSGFQLHETVTRHLQNRRYSAALLTLAAGKAVDRQASWFWHLQGEALANLGRYTDALSSFDRALAIAPTNTKSCVSQAVCYVHLQQYEQALLLCDRALDIAPQHTQAWLFRGVALQRLGQYTEAYRSYERALPPQPTSPSQTHPVRQVMHSSLAHYRRAVQSCRRWLSQMS